MNPQSLLYIYDLSGRQVSSIINGNYINNQVRLNLPEQGDNVYVVHVETPNKNYTNKLVQ